MLISFTISNYLSFKKPIAFSLIASRERQHAQRLFEHEKAGMKLLPVGALFGENARANPTFTAPSNSSGGLSFVRRIRQTSRFRSNHSAWTMSAKSDLPSS